MSVYDDTYNLLSADAPEGNKDARTFGQIDPVGNLLVDWGGTSRNNAIDRRIRDLDKLKGKISAGQRQRLEDAIASNSADWSRLTQEILGPDGRKLDDFYSQLQSDEAGYRDELKGVFDQYKNQEDLFSDPSFYGDVGDVTNAAFPTEATKGAQREALAQMRSQSSAQETAAERFQRLMAERTADANMRGQREALAQDLKARGVYGSGSEVAMSMMSQADEANRRYMADLAANAQAQQRASQMLGQSADLASKMRGQETQEGSFANQVAQFNNQSDQQTANMRSGALQAGRGVDNQMRNSMGMTEYQTGVQGADRKRGDMSSTIGTKTGLTQGGNQLRTGGMQALNQDDEGIMTDIDEKKGGLASSKTSGWLGSIG